MRLKLCSCLSLRSRYTLGHSVVSKASLTLGVPQYTKVLPAAGSTMTKCLGSSGLGACHGPLEILEPSARGPTSVAAKLSRPACSLSSSLHSKPKPCVSKALAMATELAARSMTKRALAVTVDTL